MMLAIAAFSLIKWGLVRGLDFTGGTIIEYASDVDIDTENAIRDLEEGGFSVQSIQKGEGNTYIVRLRTVPEEMKEALSFVVSDKVFGGDFSRHR